MSEHRRVAVFSTGRHDYGILRSTLLALAEHPSFDLRLWVGGMHLSPRFGRTVELVREDGLPITREIAFLSEPPDLVQDHAAALHRVGEAIADERPDFLLLVGDRTEVLAAGLAATLARVPIAHLHGGEETEGAIDNVCRHALTKLSHLHLVSHPLYADRVVQMGEDPACVVVVGAPGLDNRFRADLPAREEMERRLGIGLRSPVALVTVHPNTLAREELKEVRAVSEALAALQVTCVITQPNSDAGGAAIARFWEAWCEGRSNVALVEALGEAGYWALMRDADVVVGNSSSGVIEAPAAGLPVVNVGDRQQGRLRFGAVSDVPADAPRIAAAVREALASPRANGSSGNGFSEGAAAPRVVRALEAWDPPHPPRKTFRLLP